MFGLNEYGIAASVSLVIIILWVVAFIAAEIWKYAWAWIDDSKPEKRNFIISKLGTVVKSKWKYPVYNCGKNEAKDPIKRGSIFGYAKEEKYNETSCHPLNEGSDYVYASSGIHTETFNISFKIIPATASIPFCILICIKFYVAVMIIGSLVLTAYLSRLTRRLSKKYKIHSEDKSIHITPEPATETDE